MLAKGKGKGYSEMEKLLLQCGVVTCDSSGFFFSCQGQNEQQQGNVDFKFGLGY